MIKLFSRRILTTPLIGIALVAMLAAACTSDDPSSQQTGGGYFTGAQLESMARAGALNYGASQGTGVHVTGTGKVSAMPDLAVLSMGVEAMERTVAEARTVAAQAMEGMIARLNALGVDNSDIRTSFFNIQPQYQYFEREQTLTGYRVTNTLTVEIRDLDLVGPVIDGAVEAGGNATRINNVSFTIEDGRALADRARTLAVQDAVSKAGQYADAADFKLGNVVFITEFGGNVYPVEESRFLDAAVSSEGSLPPTQILAGELDVTVSVQVVFGIE
ncbi:MAG: SIMPL domain-containing protein [Chloroflexi bacterium]|nr:SIMPL domain-containing protein [Chloroflexota bacterium]